jgi:hypothetical protein
LCPASFSFTVAGLFFPCFVFTFRTTTSNPSNLQVQLQHHMWEQAGLTRTCLQDAPA